MAPDAVIPAGIAAHITAASLGGPRYDSSLTPAQRSHIDNGIWLCNAHASIVDYDTVTWPTDKLHRKKKEHEEWVIKMLEGEYKQSPQYEWTLKKLFTPKEYAFGVVGTFNETYTQLVAPIFADKGLKDGAEVGILMCGSAPENDEVADWETPWSFFVDPTWLRWIIQGNVAEFNLNAIPNPKQIYGMIPGWPDTYLEFIAAIVLADVSFSWNRHKDGFLVLSQASS